MVRRLDTQFNLVLAFLLFIAASCFAGEATFEGRWQTTYGVMQLEQTENRVTGSYVMDGVECPLEGEVVDRQLKFNYREGALTGEGWFRLADDGKSFSGKWRETGSEQWGNWSARRIALQLVEKGFAGLWDSSYGRLRLIEEGNKIVGIYSGGSTLSGGVDGGRFKFRYQEPAVAGEGWFEVGEDGESLTGKWKADNSSGWGDWTATRVHPEAGKKWLVVVEARWEENLADREYAFGDMLKAFFDRAPNVHVRRRFFNDENDLNRWCREAALVAEPVVLCIASHGTSEGIQVGGRSISPAAIAESLRYTSNVQLLHFSACLMMKDKLAGKIMKQLKSQADYPISGYSTSVDWATSAVLEFMYFDFVLTRGMTPQKAAEQTQLVFPIAGDRRIPKAALPPAGFKILLPESKPAEPLLEKAAKADAEAIAPASP